MVSALLPILIMAESAVAALVYLAAGDWRHGLYWAAAATITFSVLV